jgi:hypothetical protein
MDRRYFGGTEKHVGIERRVELAILFSPIGFLSGLITCCLNYPLGKLGNRLPPGLGLISIPLMGAVFGLFMAVALRLSGMLRSYWKASLLPLATAVAFYGSYVVAGVLAMGLSAGTTMGQAPSVSPVAMFAGGVVGGFIVLSAISIIVRHNRSIGILVGSLMAGVLGEFGWVLGPSLGMIIWSGIHDLGLTPTTETFQNALLSTTSHGLSLFVVWQTGMALVLAMTLRPCNVESHENSLSSVDV